VAAFSCTGWQHSVVVDGDLKVEVEDVKDKLRALLLRRSTPQPAGE
jgi:hypothetical protein